MEKQNKSQEPSEIPSEEISTESDVSHNLTLTKHLRSISLQNQKKTPDKPTPVTASQFDKIFPQDFQRQAEALLNGGRVPELDGDMKASSESNVGFKML